MSLGLKAILALVVVAALGAGAAAVWVGSRTFEGTVVSDPFEAAAHFDEARRNADKLGWTLTLDGAGLRMGPQVLRFSVASREGSPLDGAETRVRLSRPGTAWMDKAVAAQPQGSGGFAAAVAFPEPGIWDVEVQVTRGPDRLAFQRRVQVER